MTADDFFAQAVEELADSSLSAGTPPDHHSRRVRTLVERRLSKNTVWAVTLRGFLDDPNDTDLRANVEFILQRVASSDPDFLRQLSEAMGQRSPYLGSEAAVPSSVEMDIRGNRNKVKDVAGHDINKNRTMKIGTAGILALALLGGGSYAAYKAHHNSGSGGTNNTQGVDVLSSARLSLPGVSIAIPKGWQAQPLPKRASTDGRAIYTEPEQCQSFWPQGATCDKAGVTVGRISPGWGTDPRSAAEHFFRSHLYVRKLTVLHRQNFAVDGCPAYALRARITYPERPNAIEEYVAIMTGPVTNPAAVHLPNHATLDYENSDLSYVLLGFDDTASAPSPSLMNTIVKSIRCQG
jgi:hypothetical protein